MSFVSVRLCLIAAALCGLAACSSDPTGSSMNQLLAKGVQSVLPGKKSQGQSRDIAQLTRAEIAAVEVPFGLVRLPSANTASSVTIAAIKGDAVTWEASNPVTMTYIGPVLFSTRGIGPDLLTAETAPLVTMLARGQGGSYSRKYRHLDGLMQTVITPFSCTLTPRGPAEIVILEHRHQTRAFSETCSDPTEGPEGLTIENSFWIGTDGVPWKSRQWVSADAGYLEFERLVR